MIRGRWHHITCEHDESYAIEIPSGRGGTSKACKICRSEKKNSYKYDRTEYLKEYSTRPSTKRRKRDEHLQRTYGITISDEESMFTAQDGRCAACQARTKLVVDHCHRTSQVRQLLCDRCNRALGVVDDDIELLQDLIEYLQRHEAV